MNYILINFLPRDDILAMEDFEKIILVDYYDPFSDLTFDTKLVKQVFCSGDQEVKFIQAENLDRFFTPAKFIASVVAEFILRNLLPQNITDDDKWTLRLLYGKLIRRSFAINSGFYSSSDCIVYGTNICTCVNYPEDSRIIEELEAIIGCRADPLYGETLVDSLTQANAEYSQLNSYQLLLKYSTNDFYYGRKCITFVDLPMGMQEFIEKPSYHVGLVEFAEVMKINIYIIVAFTVDEQNNNEDNFIGVINVNDSILYKRVVDKLLYDSKLKLCYQSRFPYLNGKWYRHHCHNKNDIKKCLKELY